jgi:hypothetical protein
MIAMCERLRINMKPATSTRETAAETMIDVASATMRLGRLPDYLWWRAQLDACRTINKTRHDNASTQRNTASFTPFRCYAFNPAENKNGTSNYQAMSDAGTYLSMNHRSTDGQPVHEVLTQEGVVRHCQNIKVDITYFPSSNLTRTYSKEECAAEEDQFRRTVAFRQDQRRGVDSYNQNCEQQLHNKRDHYNPKEQPIWKGAFARKSLINKESTINQRRNETTISNHNYNKNRQPATFEWETTLGRNLAYIINTRINQINSTKARTKMRY